MSSDTHNLKPQKLRCVLERLRKLETGDDETDILIWLLVGERLGVPQSDGQGRLLRADRNERHFVPSATWNGRNLEAALEWCREHNREEIIRIAHDWGVPRFTSSLDAARMLVKPDMVIAEMREADAGTPAHARIQTRYDSIHKEDGTQDFVRSEASAAMLPCAICRVAIEHDFGRD